MPKHLSQQRKRHIERQQNVDWWKENQEQSIDIRTLTLDQINAMENPEIRRFIYFWRKLEALKEKGKQSSP